MTARADQQLRPTFLQRLLAVSMTCGCFVTVYNFTNWVASQRSHRGVVAFAWEQYIPFIPIFVIAYWSIDILFALAPFLIRSSHELSVFVKRIIFAIALAGAFFLAFPLELQFQRPIVPGILGSLLGALENMNNFWNLAPSLHIALRTILWPVYMSRVGGLPLWFARCWFLAIGLSTLFCWQHHIFDVYTGQILGLTVGVLFPLWNVPAWLQKTAVTARHRQLAARYFALAIVMLGLTYLGWPCSFPLIWPITSLAIFGSAYALGRPWLLGKNPETGLVATGTRVLLAPVVAVIRIVQSRYTAGEPQWRQVTERVWFGRWPSGLEVSGTVIDLTAEFATESKGSSKTRFFPLLDLVPPSVTELQMISQAISSAESEGNVYIHCALGRGRSALSVAAWLLSTGKSATVDEACERIRAAAPKVVLGTRERKRLQEYAVDV